MATEINFETTLDSGKKDNKGRRIGFTVKFGDGSDGKVYASIQNARYNEKKGEWEDFGATQRGTGFATQREATLYAYTAARHRIAKLA